MEAIHLTFILRRKSCYRHIENGWIVDALRLPGSKLDRVEVYGDAVFASIPASLGAFGALYIKPASQISDGVKAQIQECASAIINGGNYKDPDPELQYSLRAGGAGDAALKRETEVMERSLFYVAVTRGGR
jgi:hypothetical protein